MMITYHPAEDRLLVMLSWQQGSGLSRITLNRLQKGAMLSNVARKTNQVWRASPVCLGSDPLLQAIFFFPLASQRLVLGI
jgi:hypothetical protein